MDGQIGTGTKKRALDLGLPDDGVAAKIAKLDLASEPKKDVGICSEVRPKLERSPSSERLPARARTVSSTDSPLPKPTHAFDFRFVASDDEVRQLLVDQTCNEGRDVTLISHPNDLSEANLLNRLSISADGRHLLRSGKLFEDSQALTLVLDIRKLSSAELPRFNDLLDPDNPCLFDKVSQKKRPLGEHVALLVLADPAQLKSPGSTDEVPGADFWRRINRPGNTWQFDAQTDNKTDNVLSMAINKVPPLLPELPSVEGTMDDDNTVFIECHLHSHWQQLLLGGPGVDQQGRIQHIPGRLESLRAGQRVILKGANWQDLAFEQTIRQMLAQQCFESNGKLCRLPDDVQFYQMPVGEDELHSLFQTLSRSSDKGFGKGQTPQNPIIINQSNIAQWLSPIAIAPEGYAVPNTCLLEQVRAGGVVTVTSPLTEAHWFRLLGSLQTIGETTGLKPRLRVAHSRQQPKALGLTENDAYSLANNHHLQEKNREQTDINAFIYQQPAHADYHVNRHGEAALVIQVNEQTRLSQLFDNIHITSEQKVHFGRSQSGLQKALTTGNRVVFRGLESNPTLQQLLEPLIVGQPLLVNGQLQAYPKARVTVLWPESVKSPSLVFRLMVAKSELYPEPDLWDINVLKHHIRRAKLPEQALHSLYKAFNTVPGYLCKPLPEMTAGLLNNLILAAQRAQQVDHSSELLPRHWRKAINSVITHGTRQHPAVRDFMKVACWHLLPDKDQAASVDPDQLAAIINSAPRLDRKFVRQNLWPLVRAFDPAVFKGAGLELSYESPFPERREKDFMDRLCAMIAAHGPEEKRDAIAYQLAVDPAATKPWQSLAIRPTRQIKRLQDALACGWQLLSQSGQTRSDAIQALASDCLDIARGEYVTENPHSERIERIENRLSDSLQWSGSGDRPLSAMARDLYHGEMGQEDRETRRLSRLHERLKDSPVIFIEGETGTGKSYFSAKMAKASGQALVISLGPSDSEQTLMKRWQWQQQADGDRSMVQQNQTLMEWVNSKSDKDGGYVGGNYITLVLDEANLAEAGLLASLNGLWEPEPCIYVNGHPVKVSEKHRVILTGNTDHYAGRQLDPTLKEKLPRAFYPRLDQAFLRDRVVEPALLNQLQRHQINDIAHRATRSVMALWQYYQELLPEHEFTPRDLTDICSWVGWYLDRALSKGDTASCEQVNSLIRQSFRDVLGPEISETQQDALSALEIWFAARYKPDNTLRDKVHNHTLPDIQRDFEALTKEIQPEFDTSGSAVRELAQQLGQDLSRCQQAYHHDRKHGGRQATLIEGPAGRGKDATLNLLIKSVKQQAVERGESMPEVFPLNACDCSWDKVREAIQKAKVDGGIVVISEMNLIDSQHLEGELNGILAGDAHPGFHLFATINPPEYSGRKPLSPALKGRFRHLPIRQYNPTELQTIAEKVLPQNAEGKFAAEKLTQLHCRLRADLKRKNLPLQPTSRDLQNVAKAVARGSDFSDNGLHQYLTQHYQLFLMAANISLDKLPESSTLAIGKGVFDSELCEWFNRTLPNIDRPWTIRISHLDSIDEKNHEIRIKARPNNEEVKAEIIRTVARAKWQAYGLPLKPDQSDDMLIQALYRHWQQRWFAHEFRETGVDANSVFPLTEEQEQTLKMSANQPYLQEADQRIGAWNSDAVQLWPAFWHQVSDQLNHRLDDSEKHILKALRKKARVLDRITNYEHLETPQCYSYKVFDIEYPSSVMNRWWVKDINVTAEGDVERPDINDQDIEGFETLTPSHELPETLTSVQTLAKFKTSSKNGQYLLPGLMPDESILALRIQPEMAFTLIRGRYTGLHWLSVPEARADQFIYVTYVVEPREAGKKTPAEAARAGRSTRPDVHCSEGMKEVLNGLFENIADQPSEIRVGLETIKKAKNTKQRIEAITDYCTQFSGETEPENSENFFKFLVTQRQGSCRHRVPVFVAFCRYFGIPCRQIDNPAHSFAEYSADDGQTWTSVDLGGAVAGLTEIKSDSRPIWKVRDSSNVSAKIKDCLQRADFAQQQALAEACGMSLGELNKALASDRAWSATNPGLSSILKNLWQRKDLAGFSMAVSVIESLGTEALACVEKEFKAIAEAARHILSNSDKDQITELLKLLHSKIMDQAGASPHQWSRLIVGILKDSDSSKPSVIHFAYEAMESGWLDPLPTDRDHLMLTPQLNLVLSDLEGVDELKVKAAHCLKKWYQTFYPREKNSQEWQLYYKNIKEDEGDTHAFITDSHDGFSLSLEKSIVDSSLEEAWTDQPEGIPNIERMLAHNPAFVQLTPGKANHRPVIIVGQPQWEDTAIDEKADALFYQKVENSPVLKPLLEKINQYLATKKGQDLYLDQAFENMITQLQHGANNPAKGRAVKELQFIINQACMGIKSKYKSMSTELSTELSPEERTLVDNLKSKCSEAIRQAFMHYLFELTHSKGGSLTCCWSDSCMLGAYSTSTTSTYGAHDPSSPEELDAMMELTNHSISRTTIKDDYLRQAQNASNALLLRTAELTKIAEEFLNSVNLNSLYESLDR
ncbi:AAA family ATPase [Endozoicomonas sp. 8E]|uniref:AAA family ATPase n=1 Tax=Endozoicomonas sp. 8E TaxID=3035692 RepID=UPI002939288C|nr:AAA family ATPase [Endozoicomonas sp. 8E]WOG28838.1 AAA family ATPase [Endozoicomonas sp. 8E]